jgi:hypothetical protein
MIEYVKTNSWTSVQQAFIKWFCKDPPPQASIQRRFHNYENQGCICKKKSEGHPHVSEEAVQQPLIRIQRNLCGRKPWNADVKNNSVASSMYMGLHDPLNISHDSQIGTWWELP